MTSGIVLKRRPATTHGGSHTRAVRSTTALTDRENLLETLLYITQNVLDPANKALNLKVLQVWCGIIQCRDPRKLAATR